MAKTAKRRPFNVFEFGTGTFPRGLFVKAVKAREKEGTQHRRFKGVEVFGFEDEKKFREVAEKLGNIELVQADGLKELEKTKDNSLDILFEAHSVHYGGEAGIIELLKLAKQKLRPRGVFVSVQERSLWEHFHHLAKLAGLKFMVREIPEEQAKNSESWGIRQRATHEQRVKRREKWEREMPEPLQKLTRFNFEMDWWRDKEFEDMFKPTMFIFRKPRPTRKKIIPRV